jgi:hypothetical protein
MRLAAILLIAAAFMLLQQGMASAGYTENLTVQVFDQALRPVEGAQAYVEYELNSIKGDVKTKPKATDSTGYVNILFTDYEEIESSTDYAYTLYVKYGDQLVSASLVAVNGENRTYTMEVESYIAFVRVMDQTGKSLAANVTANGLTKQTSADGATFFALSPGNYTLKVERSGLVKNLPLLINAATGDRSIDVVLSYYSLEVHVKDDRRNPLSAAVEVNGAAAKTDSDGVARFGNITTDTPTVIVTYGQGLKRIQALLQVSKELDVVFDVNRPAIKDQVSTISPSGVGTIRFFVEDTGPDASGVDTVSVSYGVGGTQNQLSVYAIGYNSYEVKIPAQPAGTLVKYTISVADKEGNSATSQGDYVVQAPSQSNSSAPSQDAPLPTSQPLQNETIFVGIVALAVLAFAAIYYFNKKRAEKAIEPPPASPPAFPPSVPQQ